MKTVVRTFAVVKPASGTPGLAIPHLDQGEIFEAFSIPLKGLKLRTANELVLIAVSDAIVQEHWADTPTLQILETDDGRTDRCWEVPLHHLPVL